MVYLVVRSEDVSSDDVEESTSARRALIGTTPKTAGAEPMPKIANNARHAFTTGCNS
jgi:hypothetical protein